MVCRAVSLSAHDKLIAQYDEEFDLPKRTEILKKIDGLIYNEHPYVMAWGISCERVIYWNKFGTPDSVFRKYDDWRGAFSSWWVDPQKDKQLKQARKSGESITPIPPVEVRPWDEKSETAQR
jgi:microcin C transport system substrate-binding protein